MRTDAINLELQKSLSVERLAKYLGACGGDIHKALSLYEFNSRISEAFYTPLQSMEICLRNKLSEKLAARYGPDWFQNKQAGFFPDSCERIQNAIDELMQSRKAIFSGAVVAELGFGFWVSLLGPRYDATLWRQALYSAFKENGTRMKRDRVHGRFNALRRFRNRIAHHEPIFLNNLPAVHSEIIEATNWMCSCTASWAVFTSRFTATFATKP